MYLYVGCCRIHMTPVNSRFWPHQFCNTRILYTGIAGVTPSNAMYERVHDHVPTGHVTSYTYTTSPLVSFLLQVRFLIFPVSEMPSPSQYV